MPEIKSEHNFPADLITAGAILENQAAQISSQAVLYPVEKNTAVESLHHFMIQEGLEHIVMLDTKVHGVEDLALSRRCNYGYEVTFADDYRLTVIDHHVSDPELGGQISTGILVDRYEEEQGAFPVGASFMITHKDCDSLISYLRMSGYLPRDSVFSSAVLSADHTFERNSVGDLAQALEGVIVPEKCLIRSDLEFSIRNLGRFLQGKELEPLAAELLNARLRQREAWQEKLAAFTILENGTAFINLGKVPSDPCPESVPALLPEVNLILVFHEWKGGEGSARTVLRTLRGMAGQEFFRLDEDGLQLKEVVPGWGGRSGAGSDRRSTMLLPESPELIAQQLDRNLGDLLLARGEDPFAQVAFPAEGET